MFLTILLFKLFCLVCVVIAGVSICVVIYDATVWAWSAGQNLRHGRIKSAYRD